MVLNIDYYLDLTKKGNRFAALTYLFPWFFLSAVTIFILFSFSPFMPFETNLGAGISSLELSIAAIMTIIIIYALGIRYAIIEKKYIGKYETNPFVLFKNGLNLLTLKLIALFIWVGLGIVPFAAFWYVVNFIFSQTSAISTYVWLIFVISLSAYVFIATALTYALTIEFIKTKNFNQSWDFIKKNWREILKANYLTTILSNFILVKTAEYFFGFFYLFGLLALIDIALMQFDPIYTIIYSCFTITIIGLSVYLKLCLKTGYLQNIVEAHEKIQIKQKESQQNLY